MAPSHVTLAAAVLATVACADSAEGPGWLAEHDTLSDTVVVRTISGQIWPGPSTLIVETQIGETEGLDEFLFGRITGLAVAQDGSTLVYDAQARALRLYDRDGRFVRQFGRDGSGPGEYRAPDGGLAILHDGRVLLRDPSNARIQVWSPSGEPIATWPIASGYSTAIPIVVDTEGFVFSPTVDYAVAAPRPTLMVKYSPDTGQPLDTLIVPEPNFQPARVMARRNGSQTIQGVPFTPNRTWSFARQGTFVFGISSHYAIHVLGPTSNLRIERVFDPVPVQTAEKSDWERAITENMRQMVPDWTWNGPPIPEVKPPFRYILVADDGRIWVQLWQAGRRLSGSDPALPQWEEDITYDVFEPTGEYLGKVTAPSGFLPIQPRPVIRGDTVWAVMIDSLGVHRISRLRRSTAASDRDDP